MMENKKAYIDNSRFMEFVDEIATQMTETAFKEPYIELKNDLDNHIRFMFIDEAQDFYNERYDEIETMVNKIMGVYPQKS
jgi:predicted nucleotidyltransferase